MGFFETLKSCVYSPAFYAGMRERSWTDAAKYYAVVAFIIVFALVSPIWALLLSATPEVVDTVAAVYPEELEVTLADGVLSTNQAEPYGVPNTFTKELPGNFFVFDTRNDEYTPSSLEEADTIVLFKRTFAVLQNSDSQGLNSGDQRIFPYGTSTGTTTLTKADITSFAETIKPYVRPVAIVGGAFLFVLAVLIGGVGMLVFHLIYVLFPGLLVLLYFKLRKRDETFKTAYTTALFASIPVTIVASLFGLFATLPLFTYTFLVLVLIIANDTRRESEPVQQ